VRDDVARREQLEDLRERRVRLADVQHHRQRPGGAPRAADRLEIVIAGDVLRQPHLHADDPVAVPLDRALRGVDVRRGDVHQLAAAGDARPRDVQKDAHAVRRGPRDLHQRVDVVRARRSAVRHRRDAVAQERGRRQVGRADVHVDVDQAWRDDLSARIDHVGGIRRGDARLDRADPPAFDADGGKILNEQIPLDMLIDAARRDVLPKTLRREIAATGWVRSVLLGDEGTAKTLATLLQELAPDLKAPLQTYLDAGDAESRNFAAVLLMLRFPGMRPYVQAGFGRLTPPGKLDELRDNWWCPFRPVPNGPPDYYRVSSVLGAPLLVLYPEGAPKAQFLSSEQRARGETEWSRLTALPPAPEYLGTQAVAWVTSHASDPRAPEALHLAVRAVRYGCGAKAGASKAAFQLLQSRYPGSEWARKTKYWY